jgi:hypothetical protein
MLNLNAYQMNVLMQALNDREGVLSTDYENAWRKKSYALASQRAQELKELRALAEIVAAAYSSAK